jgi:excisionase family DNA binding protein
MDVMGDLETELLKPSEIASFLGVSRSWVYAAAKAGRIPCVRLGGRDGPLRFVPRDVERWLENARRTWLPGDSLARTATRASTRLRAEGPQLALDGLSENRPRS